MLTPARFGLASAVEADRLASQAQFPFELGDHARENLHQRAFAGAVFADDGMHFTAANVERHIGQGHDAGESLGNVVDRDDDVVGHFAIDAITRPAISPPATRRGLMGQAVRLTD